MDKHWDADRFDHYLEHNLPDPTDEAEIIVFTDISADETATGAGWIVLSRDGGKLCHGRAWKLDESVSTTSQEVWGIRRAIEQIEEMDWLGDGKRVNVYTDCNPVKDVIAGSSSISDSDDAQYLSERLSADQIVCISRNVNNQADDLSSDARFTALRETQMREAKIQFRQYDGTFDSDEVRIMDSWRHNGSPHLSVRLPDGQSRQYHYGRVCSEEQV